MNLENDPPSFQPQWEKYLEEGDKRETEPVIKEYPSSDPDTNAQVLFVAGMAADFEHIDDACKALANTGRNVFGLVHPKKISFRNLPFVQQEKSKRIKTELDNRSISKIPIVATSEAALNATDFAVRNSDMVESLVLVNPAGIAGEKILPFAIPDLIKRVNKELNSTLRNAEGESGIMAKIESLRDRSAEIKRKHGVVYALEGLSIALTSLLLKLKILKERGVKVMIVQAADDKIFEALKVQKNLKDIAEFRLVPGGHYNFFTHPQDVMPVVSRALDEMAGGETVHHEH